MYVSVAPTFTHKQDQVWMFSLIIAVWKDGEILRKKGELG